MLRRSGIRLVAEIAGTPGWETLPAVEVSRAEHLAGESGVLTLRLGGMVHLGRDLVIEMARGGSGTVDLGEHSYVQGNVRLTVFGGSVVLGPRAHLRQGVVVRCSGGDVRLGELSQLGDYTVVHCARRIDLGDYVQCAEHCSFVDSDHVHDGSDTWVLAQPVTVGEVLLGDNVILGGGARVLRDAHIAKNSFVAAGAVVLAGDHPESSLLAGIPARVVRTLAPGGEAVAPTT
jgi:acetyltransferase-like isoleucine patch superfamily enzyme